MGKTKTAFISETAKEPKKVKKEKAEKIHIAGLKGGQRVKAIEADLPAEASAQAGPVEEKTSKKRKKIRSKKYQDAYGKIDRNKLYSPEDAIKLIKETSISKFDGTVEVHLIVKKVGLSVNVKYPNAAGKSKKVEVASDSTINKLKTGKIDFDVLLATPDMMQKLVPFAKLLGPRGLMPNPKNGTLIKNAKEAADFSTAAVVVKTEKEAPVIHTVIGKLSMENNKLNQNLKTLLDAVSSKQIIRAYLASTMGPSIKLATG